MSETRYLGKLNPLAMILFEIILRIRDVGDTIVLWGYMWSNHKFGRLLFPASFDLVF